MPIQILRLSCTCLPYICQYIHSSIHNLYFFLKLQTSENLHLNASACLLLTGVQYLPMVQFFLFHLLTKHQLKGLKKIKEWKYMLPLCSAGKESACNAGDLGSIPGLGRSPGEGKGYPLQYSGLENSMDCIVHGVSKSWTPLSDFHFHNM